MYQSPEEAIPSAVPVANDAAGYGILPPEMRELLRDDLDFIPDDPAELRRAVARMPAHINHADWRFIKLTAAMDRTRGWAESGYVSLGNWVDHRRGLGPCAARERVHFLRGASPSGTPAEAPCEGQAPARAALALPRLRALSAGRWRGCRTSTRRSATAS